MKSIANDDNAIGLRSRVNQYNGLSKEAKFKQYIDNTRSNKDELNTAIENVQEKIIKARLKVPVRNAEGIQVLNSNLVIHEFERNDSGQIENISQDEILRFGRVNSINNSMNSREWQDDPRYRNFHQFSTEQLTRDVNQTHALVDDVIRSINFLNGHLDIENVIPRNLLQSRNAMAVQRNNMENQHESHSRRMLH